MNIEKNIEKINNELKEKYLINEAYKRCIKYIKFEDLFTITNIYISAMRCASGFRKRNDTQSFFKAPWLNSYKLCKNILEGTFKPKYYSTKCIMERGKVREIKPPVFESKVVQKLLCDWIIRPLLEPEMINTSYASIKGRGTDKMYKDVLRAINSEVNNETAYIVMTDFKGYFSTIDVGLLELMLKERINDEKIIKLIMKFSKKDGLSLGNELSQIPASFYPTSIDKIIKKNVSTGKDFRYMDDTLFIVKSKAETVKILNIFENEAKKLKLILKEPKVIPIKTNFIFCKERFLFDKRHKKYFRLCNKEIFIREKRKLRLFNKKLKNEEMKIENIKNQYKCVRNSIAHRKNVKENLKRLDIYYNSLFVNYN